MNNRHNFHQNFKKSLSKRGIWVGQRQTHSCSKVWDMWYLNSWKHLLNTHTTDHYHLCLLLSSSFQTPVNNHRERDEFRLIFQHCLLQRGYISWVGWGQHSYASAEIGLGFALSPWFCHSDMMSTLTPSWTEATLLSTGRNNNCRAASRGFTDISTPMQHLLSSDNNLSGRKITSSSTVWFQRQHQPALLTTLHSKQ